MKSPLRTRVSHGRILTIGGLLSGFLFWCYISVTYPRSSLSQVTFINYQPPPNFALMGPDNTSIPVKTILLWNYAHRVEMASFGLGQEPFIEKCSVKHCFLTNNRSFLPVHEFDAVLVNIPVLWVDKLPAVRSAHQRHVFFTQESPVYNIENLDKHKGYFNWTMSYRTNSDIPYLYGRISLSASGYAAQGLPSWPSVSDAHWRAIKSRVTLPKRKLAAWFVSHCDTDSKREVYIKKLQEYIPVDVYGKCGPLKCEWDEPSAVSRPTCYDMVEQDYKFYLSFENSVCSEYVTEKFFAVMERYNVPIVYGGANYSAIAPPHSYIDAMDFSPQELASYLTMLDRNETLYGEYFWWKDFYRVETGYEDMSREAFCHLCAKLHAEEPPKVYEEDLWDEWSPEMQCRRYHH